MKNKIINEIKNFVLNDKENWFNEINDHFFDEPIIKFTSPYNSLFSDYKTIIGEEHLTPKEAFEMEFGENTFQNGTVISVLLPLNYKIRESNRAQKEWPSKEWVLNKTFGDGIIIGKTGKYTEQLLLSLGYNAVAPYGAKWFKTYKTPSGPSSIWSERHIAYAAGHGTFSLNDGLITEKGIAVRFISIVTNLMLDIEKVEVKEYHANCLFYAKNKCGACINRCPVNAITEKGHDKIKCLQYCYGEESGKIALAFGANAKNGSGCGLCQTGVPCEYQIPIMHK